MSESEFLGYVTMSSLRDAATSKDNGGLFGDHVDSDEYDVCRKHQETTLKERTWIVRTVHGFAGTEKVLDYDLKVLVQYGGFLASFSDGSFFTFDSNAMKFIVMYFIAYVSLSMGMSILELNLILQYRDALADFVPIMSKMVPFVLGLYLALALSRWWALRMDGLGLLLNAVVNICMLSSCLLHGEQNRKCRMLIARWAFASVRMVVKAARDQTKVTDMYSKGLLTLEEVKLLTDIEPWGRASMMWSWILRLLLEAGHNIEGPLPHSTQIKRATQICLDARAGITTMDTYLTTQLPFAYVHLITILVNMNNCFLIFKCASASAVAINDWQQSSIIEISKEGLTSLIIPLLYYGLLSISYIISDPFGEEMLDFPVASFISYTSECCEAVMRAQETFPGVPEDPSGSTSDCVFVASGLQLARQASMGTPLASASNSSAIGEEEARERFRKGLLVGLQDPTLLTADPVMAATPLEQPAELQAPEPPGTCPQSMAAGSAAEAGAEVLNRELRAFAESFTRRVDALSEQVAALRQAASRGEQVRASDVEKLCTDLKLPAPPSGDTSRE